MKKNFALFLFLIVTVTNLAAQNNLSFSASDLQEMAQRYSGNSLNWPILVRLANHDVSSNTFVLTQADVTQLQNFSSISLSYEEQQDRIKQLIGEGATIFAKNELTDTNKAFSDYLEAVKEGDIEVASSIGSSLESMVDNLESTLTNNRLVNVQAQLSKKSGNVDKRIGLLASWQDAFEGDLFQESDGIKTAQESYATLSFTDGSNITVNPVTTAVIRKSRIDRLDESADTEITLVEGGLLSKLSAAGREKSNYILNAGASTTELKTQNFYAENEAGDNVKLTNYDGVANVSVNDITITINKNEGTIIRGNSAPLPPIKLLPAPELTTSRKDTVIYSEDFIYSFAPVEKAANYIIQYSPSYNFEEDITEIEINRTRISIQDIPLGTTHIKVLAVDELGLRGPYSQVTRVIRNVDTQPPPIFGEKLNSSILFTTSDQITIEGVTEPDAKVSINDSSIPVTSSGAFKTNYSLSGIDEKTDIKAVDNSGNESIKSLRVVKLTPEVVFKINTNLGALQEELTASDTPITFSGRAYPNLEVVFENNQVKKLVKTDSQGRWGVTMNVQQGELSVTFKDVQSGMTYLTKSFTAK